MNSIMGFACDQPSAPLPSIEVTAPKDLMNVLALNKALSALSQNVTECVHAGRKPEVCQCSYPADLIRLKKNYDIVIKQHPDWKDQILSYRYLNKEGRNISGTLVLQNLRRQLEVLKCD